MSRWQHVSARTTAALQRRQELERAAAAQRASARALPPLPPPGAPQDVHCGIPCTARKRRPTRERVTPLEIAAVRAAEACRETLCAVAHEVTTCWHLPWRTRGSWPARLRTVAQRFVRGDLAAARYAGHVKFCDMLLDIGLPDRTDDRRYVATFALMWAQCIYDVAKDAEEIQSAEAIDALDATTSFLALLQGRYRALFAGEAEARIDVMMKTLIGLATEIRACQGPALPGGR